MKHEGHQYPDDVNDWFSAAIGKKVIAIHSPGNLQVDLDAKRMLLKQDGDTRKTFTRDAALHIVNVASVDELRRRVWARYPEITDPKEKIYVNVEQFRANFVINTGRPFEEDYFCEMRLESCLMRTPGPSVRCGVIRTDYEKKDMCPEFEPMATLKTFREIPTVGNVFGMYYQMEILDR